MNLQQEGYQNKKPYLLVVGVLLLVLAIGAAGFFAKSYFDLQANPNKIVESESKRLMETVGKLYQLPENETPIIGKVQDQDKLKDQPFFKSSQNGDDILIYQEAKVALLYRASENRLVNVGPVAIDAAPQQDQPKE